MESRVVKLVEDDGSVIPLNHPYCLETNPDCRVCKTRLRQNYCAEQNDEVIILPLGMKDKIGSEVLQEIPIPPS
jgi:hypothetical protein